MRNPKCRLCGLWATAGTVCIWGDGPADASVAIVGEAPGEAEARTGKPFQGRSGQLLRDALDEVGIVGPYITNVVKCRPPGNRQPTKEEIAACRPYLEEELQALQPQALVALGATAAKATMKVAKITEHHGRITTTNGRINMPCYHPAFVLRDPSRGPSFVAALRNLANEMTSGGLESTVKWDIITDKTWDNFVHDFRMADEYSFDVETTGLFPYRDDQKIHCLGIGLPSFAWVLPLNLPGYPLVDHAKAKRVLSVIHELSKEKEASAQNGKFDNSWLNFYYGLEFHLGFDTMMAHHTLDENSPHGLKDLVRRFLGEPEYALDAKEMREAPDPIRLMKYCAHDVAYTLRLKRMFEKDFRKDRLSRRLFYGLVMPAARAFRRIDDNGHFIRLDLFNTTRTRLIAEADVLETKMNESIGRVINWNSPPQVGQVLFKELNLPITVLTDKGAPSTGEAALVNLVDSHPLANQLMDYRNLKKLVSTYLDGLQEFMVGPQLYLSTKLQGTVTGRYSSRLHSIPRDRVIRSLFSAPEGWTFVQGDFSQAEVRVVAIMSGDPEMQRCFTSGVDIHWRTLMNSLRLSSSGTYLERAKEVASTIAKRKVKTGTEAVNLLEEWGHERVIGVDPSWKEARKRAKGIVFGFIYGMGAESFVEYAWTTYGIRLTLAESERERDAFFSLYSALPEWHNDQRRLARSQGYVRNLAGRTRRLPGVYSSERNIRGEAERQAINAPVQGYIGDHKAMAVVAIEAAIPRDRLRIVGEHHDAILMWSRDGTWEETKPEVARLMKTPPLVKEWGIDLSVPLEVDFSIGPWGS